MKIYCSYFLYICIWCAYTNTKDLVKKESTTELCPRSLIACLSPLSKSYKFFFIFEYLVWHIQGFPPPQKKNRIDSRHFQIGRFVKRHQFKNSACPAFHGIRLLMATFSTRNCKSFVLWILLKTGTPRTESSQENKQRTSDEISSLISWTETITQCPKHQPPQIFRG